MPGTETAGRYHAETTLPARSPVRNRGRETPGNAGISAHSTGERGDTRTGWLKAQSPANPSLGQFPSADHRSRTPGNPRVWCAQRSTRRARMRLPPVALVGSLIRPFGCLRHDLNLLSFVTVHLGAVTATSHAGPSSRG